MATLLSHKQSDSVNPRWGTLRAQGGEPEKEKGSSRRPPQRAEEPTAGNRPASAQRAACSSARTEHQMPQNQRERPQKKRSRQAQHASEHQQTQPTDQRRDQSISIMSTVLAPPSV
eukprot:gene5907-33477_t